MQINHTATIERCKVINAAEVGRQCGVTRVMVHQIIRGIYPYMTGEGALRVLEKLRSMGMLVEEEDSKVDRAA